LRTGGRIAVCGGISQYSVKEPEMHSFNPMSMVYTQQRIEGFLCSPWLTGQKGHFIKDMAAFYREGKIVPQETYFDGVERWAEGFQALFTGKNIGKVVIRTNV
jgi:NADPH-dependent curcumin reductase CurA